MFDVLRSHAIGKLPNEDTETLMEFQMVIGARINAIQHRLTFTNHFKNEEQELRESLKWFTPIRDEIGGLLTRKFHAKAV